MAPRASRPALLAAVVLLSVGCAEHRDDAAGSRSTVANNRGSTATDGGWPALTVTGSSYDVPDPLPTGEPGEVIAATDPRLSELLDGATRREVLYLSSGAAGAPVAVSGTLVLPDGEPPPGGWPVVAWGHGTTGVADACAPSLTENLFYNEYAQQVRGMLRAGYAVVATDYIGLGTPGVHSYSVGQDLGNAMADGVAAAHELEPGALSADWFAVGHSEGGQAALFASRAAGRHPELHLLGTIAIGPSSSLGSALRDNITDSLPYDAVVGLYMLAGLSTVDPSIEVADLLGPEGQLRLAAVIGTDCLLDSAEQLEGTEASTVFDVPDDTIDALSGLLGDVGDPDRTATAGPLLVVQGETDRETPAELTSAMVDNLEALGVDVTYRVYGGLDHDRVLGPSSCETLAWMAAHGGPGPSGCTPEPTDMS